MDHTAVTGTLRSPRSQSSLTLRQKETQTLWTWNVFVGGELFLRGHSTERCSSDAKWVAFNTKDWVELSGMESKMYLQVQVQVQVFILTFVRVQ